MGQNTAEMKTLKGIHKAMNELNSQFRIIHNQALVPGHYYRGAEGVVIKVVRRTPSGKTVYITTHSDDDNPCLQAKRVKIYEETGEEYICYKNNHYVIGVWNETDREAFRNYIIANIGNPCAVI